MSEEQLAEILKYSSSKELYIVTWNNLLKILFCPFKARAIVDIGNLKRGRLVWVQEVKITKDLVTVYIIEGKAYYYYHFIIIS
ncbi:hypothetical protein [uncultured Maribacter sp.]|uniref:hypothetical protein n=1 Tax=uncultured Maribacter sp. TaxID=431308 RepID=UPI002611F9BC|nr:hypothetical protein [uncultured Maribacter sp.]